jgi:expansin
MRVVAVPALCLGLFFAIACGDDDASPDESSPSGGSSSGSTYSTSTQTGIATFYDADGSGNCSFEKSGDLHVVALNFPEYADSAMCGACLEVTGPKGTTKVRVTDSCPPCAKNHLDLSKEAFLEIAEEKEGRVAITYRATPCTASGPIAYHFKDGSSKYWTAIQVRNHTLPVTKLEYQKGGTWVAMKRSDYNYFLEESGVGDTPGGLHVRVTAADGQTLEDTLPEIEAEATFPGKAQF